MCPVSFIRFQLMTHILSWPPVKTYASNPRRKRPYPFIKIVWWSSSLYHIMVNLFIAVYVMEEAFRPSTGGRLIVYHSFHHLHTLLFTVCFASLAPTVNGRGPFLPPPILQQCTEFCMHWPLSRQWCAENPTIAATTVYY